MKKSGLADSPFFSGSTHSQHSNLASQSRGSEKITKQKKQNQNKSMHASQPASKQTSQLTSRLAIIKEPTEPWPSKAIVETIRASVKNIGKEATTYRFTPEEKKALLETTYSYKLSGLKTNENEVARIAINLILADYQENGRNSVLEKVLGVLHN